MIKQLFKTILNKSGYELRRRPKVSLPGSEQRPVGDIILFLQDLKARGLNVKFVLDVGANMAHWSFAAKSVFTDAIFYLIEPQEEMKPFLEEFCQKNQGSKYFLAGAASNTGFETITIWEDYLGSSFLPSTDELLKQQGKQRVIEMMTIDQLVEIGKIQMPDLIKLDIQGYELEALKGANSTFGKTEVYILEVSLFAFEGLNVPVFSDVVDFMLQRGYVVYDFAGFGRRPFDGALGQCDVCFVKKDGLLRRYDKW